MPDRHFELPAHPDLEYYRKQGAHRWIIERTIALLHWFRRLRIRWEIRDARSTLPRASVTALIP